MLVRIEFVHYQPVFQQKRLCVDETSSPDGKPEKRRYRAVYLAKNQPVGQYSDIVAIVTTP
ncbi:MAG TPA: hypothetical protein VF599_10625 [Pyrinomonadaceae bacterium]